jgi:hypothetical protein
VWGTPGAIGAQNKITCPFVVADVSVWIFSLCAGGRALVSQGYREEGWQPLSHPVGLALR